MAGVYCVPNDVRNEVLLFDTTVIPDSELTAWIADAGRVIDARLAAKYQMPAPTPLVGPTEILLVAARNYGAARALRKHFSDRRFGDTNPWDPYWREFLGILTSILADDLFSGYLPRPTARPMIIAERYVEPGTVPRFDDVLAHIDLELGKLLTPSEKKDIDQIDLDLAAQYWGPKV